MKKIGFLCLIFFIFFNLFFSTAESETMFDIGRKIFLEKGACATCHTLYEADSQGQIGPDLNLIKPDVTTVLSTVTNGIGVMPAYKDQLTSEEIEAVAFYVSMSVDN